MGFQKIIRLLKLNKRTSNYRHLYNYNNITHIECCLSPQMSCVEYVLDVCGDLVNVADSEGATPLHYTATGASSLLAQLLINKACIHTL